MGRARHAQDHGRGGWAGAAHLRLTCWSGERGIPRVSEAFPPALRTALEGMGYDKEHVYYHISDEPSPGASDSYRAAKSPGGGFAEGCQVIDALSSLEFYRQGLVRQPVPANDHIQPFIDAQVPGSGCTITVSRAALCPTASPWRARNRIMGVDVPVRHHALPALGVQFYNSKFSLHPVDPYRDARRLMHSLGEDPSLYILVARDLARRFLSVRAEVQDDALLDSRRCSCWSAVGRVRGGADLCDARCGP